MEFEVINDINVKVALCQGDIIKLNVDVIVNSVNKTLTVGGGIDGAINEAAGPRLVDECQTLTVCKTGESKAAVGHKLPAKYVFHTLRFTDKMTIS